MGASEWNCAKAVNSLGHGEHTDSSIPKPHVPSYAVSSCTSSRRSSKFLLGLLRNLYEIINSAPHLYILVVYGPWNLLSAKSQEQNLSSVLRPSGFSFLYNLIRITECWGEDTLQGGRKLGMSTRSLQSHWEAGHMAALSGRVNQDQLVMMQEMGVLPSEPET